jgi:hypothetical protein
MFNLPMANTVVVERNREEAARVARSMRPDTAGIDDAIDVSSSGTDEWDTPAYRALNVRPDNLIEYLKTVQELANPLVELTPLQVCVAIARRRARPYTY